MLDKTQKTGYKRIQAVLRHCQLESPAGASVSASVSANGSSIPTHNRRIVLKKTPADGDPSWEHFEMVQEELPEVGEGQMLLKTLWCSIDPYMRTLEGVMNKKLVGHTMIGGTVSQVLQSRSPEWKEGDLVVGYYGWQEYVVAKASDVQWHNPQIPIEKWDIETGPPSTALGALGMTGYTAYFGLLEIGQPKRGETVVVSAASGAVGQIVGQLAKLLGCHVVGVAGGSSKCAYVVETLGFDACVDYKANDLVSALSAACPRGVDVYFENVGGDVLEAVLPLLNKGCRVPVCGFVSQYNVWNKMTHKSPMQRLTECGVPKMGKKGDASKQGFRFFFWMEPRFLSKRHSALAELSSWVKEGKIQYRESVEHGLESAVDTFSGMLKGKNFGKTMVKVA